MLLFFVACESPEASITDDSDTTNVTQNTFYTKPYYYPVEKLRTGKVYEYSRMQDSAAYIDHYWHFQTIDSAGQTFLVGKRYNPFFEQDQYTREWVVQDGVVTTTYEMLIKDTTLQTTTRYVNEVDQNIVFPFNASLDSNMAYRFTCKLTLPPDFVTVRLVRDRQFSQPLVYPYKGEEIPAVAFSCTDLYDLEDREQGGYWEHKTASVEIYAQDMGLVYTEEKKGEEPSEVTRLTNIYTLQQFQTLQGQL